MKHCRSPDTNPNKGHSFFRTSNYEAHKNINPPPVGGICGWFLNHPKFQEWKSNDHENLLWLSADPGRGKSVLSKTFIDGVLPRDTSATTCYLFFKDQQGQNSVATAICALLHQDFCAKTEFFKEHGTQAIVEERELLTNFESLWGHNGDTKMKFLVTSRPYGDIERRFGKMTRQFPSIRLAGEEEWEDISHEIDMVMNVRVYEIMIERDLADDLGDALKRRLSDANTYLWLHLTLDILRDFHGHTKAKILREFDKVPESVEQAYEKKILQRCNCRYQEDEKRLLEIIIAAHRPLELSKIEVALEILPSSTRLGDLDLEGSAKRKQWIRDACGLFVGIVDSRVFLIHQTAREFLVQQGAEKTVAGTWRRSVDLQNAHLSLVKLCLTYLCFEDFRMKGQQYRPQFIPQESFLENSGAYWISHVIRVHNFGR